MTPYVPLTAALYNIHSDAVFPSDNSEIIVPGPGAQIDPGKRNRVITIDEGFADFKQLRVAGVVVPGMINTADNGDTLVIAADPNDPNGHSILTLTSINTDDPGGPSPAEAEPSSVRADEAYTTYLVTSVDIPEPSTVLLMGIGLVGLTSWISRRGQRAA